MPSLEGRQEVSVEKYCCTFGDTLSATEVDTSDHSLIAGRAAPMEVVLLRWMFSKFVLGTGEKIGRTQ